MSKSLKPLLNSRDCTLLASLEMVRVGKVECLTNIPDACKEIDPHLCHRKRTNETAFRTGIPTNDIVNDALDQNIPKHFIRANLKKFAD